VSLDFLAVHAGPDAIARSPMEGLARAAGARFEVRDGWNVAVAFPSTAVASVAVASVAVASVPQAPGTPAPPVGWADTSHERTLELQAPADELDAVEHLRLGEAVRAGDAWWCRLTRTRALILGGVMPVAGALDVTSTYASLTLLGPMARETIARFCALDLRPRMAPVGALRPGSVARQPGIVIREAEDRYRLLFGWATGEYVWSVVADAAEHLGGRPVGIDQL